jgi:fructokinase
LAKRLPKPSVFFFDRVSRGALELARASAEHGALVVFEPSGVRDEGLFREAVGLSHVVKYSHERLGHLRQRPRHQHPFLEIETVGSDGLRYRVRGRRKESGQWKEMRAYGLVGLRDTAGAGDWCTAGILHALGPDLRKGGARAFTEASNERIEDALRLGQALAAMKCRYEGARGVMYALTKRRLQAAVKGILKGEAPVIEEDMDDRRLRGLLKAICPSCDTIGVERGGRRRREEAT